MEQAYMPKKKKFVSDVVNLGDFFHAYANEFKTFVNFGCKSLCKRMFIRNALDITDEEYSYLNKTMSLTKLKPRPNNDQFIIPIEGFKKDFSNYKVPVSSSLASVNAIKDRTTKDKVTLTRRLKYVGEKDMDHLLKRDELDRFREDMFCYKEFLITVRVYIPAKHKHFILDADKNQRMKRLYVSQEFLIPGGATLDTLRDRIICQGDYQSTEGDVSSFPWSETTLRTMDSYKSGMFYIGNSFYIDKRFETCEDYSVPIVEWGKKKKIQFGDVAKMENTYLCQLNIRLGYPYVFVHLGGCEHLIIFTDARLLHPRDIHVYNLYPVMRSYANLRGKYCKMCRKRLAKFIVVDSDRLPFTKMYSCAYCLYLYHYSGHKKIGNFKVYKYVDRVALL